MLCGSAPVLGRAPRVGQRYNGLSYSECVPIQNQRISSLSTCPIGSPCGNLNVLRKALVHVPKAAGSIRSHPINSSRGRLSRRRCSSRASRAISRRGDGMVQSLRAHFSSSSRVSIICEAIASCSCVDKASSRRRASSRRPGHAYILSSDIWSPKPGQTEYTPNERREKGTDATGPVSKSADSWKKRNLGLFSMGFCLAPGVRVAINLAGN